VDWLVELNETHDEVNTRSVKQSCFISTFYLVSESMPNANEVHGCSTGILGILLRMPGLEKRPFKGKHTNSYIVYETGILFKTKTI
jgi:hypothetical protein